MGYEHNDLNHCTADDYNNCFTVYDDDNDEYVTLSAACPSSGIHHRLASARSYHPAGHYDRPNLNFLNDDLYYDNYDDHDPPAHNDDDYARAHNDDSTDNDGCHDNFTDREHLFFDSGKHFDNIRTEWDDYLNRADRFFDDIAHDYKFPPPANYYG